MTSLLDYLALNWYTIPLYTVVVLGALFYALLYVFVPKSSIRNLPGPPAKSWFLGNMRELDTRPVGDCEFHWAEQYGSSYRLKGGYGEDVFVTSDPKALQFILQTSSYNIVKNAFVLERSRNLLGESILSTEGNPHKRHRKAMLPAFGFPETKALTHVFQSKGAKLVGQWKTKLAGNGYLDINVHPWIAKATLDAIGEAAFDYEFGVMDDKAGELGRTYRDMFVSIAAFPSWTKVAWNNFTMFLPRMLVQFTTPPTKANRWVKRTRGIARDTASMLLDEKWSVNDPEEGKKDVMGVLVKSNATENERSKLSRMEVIDQMGAIMLAGHETTANTMAWALWELSKNQDVQNKLREEIIMYGQGFPGAIPVTEYDGMEYTVAFIKEIFRFHPIVPRLSRAAGRDVHVPLSEPIHTTDGQVIHEVFLKKRIRIFANLAAYNRHPDVWGKDPHVFRPERWLNTDLSEGKVKFGVYGNLGIFGAGIHACIGWRFALYEIQSFLIALVQSFRFELPENPPEIRRTFAGVMVPQIEGDERHVAMPLRVIPLKQ